MSLDWTTVVVSTLTAGSAVGVGRAARRSRRQERRDDFAAVTERMDKDLARLDARVTAQDSHIARQDVTISGQTSAIGYLHALLRTMVSFTRAAGLEPPPAPASPDDARPFLHDIGV